MGQKLSPGDRLRRDMDEALRRAGEDRGVALVWDEVEELALERAADAANRAEEIRLVLDNEMRSEEANPNVIVRLSAELRALDKSVVDLCSRLNLGIGQAKSARHQKAARARWDRRIS